jgi:GNAT superfamily N-acetyltransferase
MQLECRIAIPKDLPEIAHLRWRLRVDDEPVTDRAAYDRFVADFIAICSGEWQPGEIVHWIATDGERAIGVMSVVVVRKLPSPETLRDRWGYISNSYVLPEARNVGAGQQLLTAIKDWARREGLELLVVWPSDRAYPFYERAGFRRHADPLVLKLRSE